MSQKAKPSFWFYHYFCSMASSHYFDFLGTKWNHNVLSALINPIKLLLELANVTVQKSRSIVYTHISVKHFI